MSGLPQRVYSWKFTQVLLLISICLPLYYAPCSSAQTPTMLPPWKSMRDWSLKPLPAEARAQLATFTRREQFKVNVNPDDALAWTNLAFYLFSAREFDQAAKAFRQVLRLKPSTPHAYAQYLQSLYLTGNTDTVRWLMAQPTGTLLEPLAKELISGELDYESEDYYRTIQHLEAAIVIIRAPETQMDPSLANRVTKVIINNLIHANRHIGNQHALEDWRLKLAEMNISKPLIEGLR